jgi:hypothetical protein
MMSSIPMPCSQSAYTTRPENGARTFAPRAVSIVTPFAAQLIEMLMRIDRVILKHAREIGDQGLDCLLFSMQPRQFLVAALHLLGERRQGRAPLVPGSLEIGYLTAGIVLQGFELLRLLIDLGDQILQARLLGADLVDPRRPLPGEITVIRQGPAHLSRVGLIQQQPHFIAPPEQVIGTYLRCERGALGLQCRPGAALLGAKVVALALRSLFRRVEALEPAALLGDAELRLTQTRAEGIALLELAPQSAGQIRDALAHGREFGLRLDRILGARILGGRTRIRGGGRRTGGGRLNAHRQYSERS